MSQDLLTQLAEYGTYCDERQGSVVADEVIDPIVPLPMPTHPTAPRRGWLIAAAVAALILIVIGGVTWLTPFNDSIPPTDEPTATTIAQRTVPETTVPAPSQTTVPPTTLPAGPTAITPRAAESVTWTRHPGSAPPGGWITETSIGLVAVHTEDFQAPVVYLSSNGYEWSKVPIPAGASVQILPQENHSDAFTVEPTEAGIWLSRAEAGLWFADLESWSSGDPSWEEMVSEADLLELKQSPPIDTRWASGIGSKARIGSTSLFAVEWELIIDYEAILDLPPGYTDIQHDDLDSCFSGGTPGQLSVRGRDSSGEEVCLTRVTVVDGADGVSVLDEDGDQVAFIENAVAEFDYGSGGPHFFPPSGMLDLYASTDGRLELIRSIDATYPCGQGLERGDGVVVHRIDCGDDKLAMSTTDGMTWEEVPFPDESVQHHPLGFFWTIRGNWVVHVSADGETWTEVAGDTTWVFETPSAFIVTQRAEEGGPADEIVVYNGESPAIVKANWPVGGWPEHLRTIGDTLIVIDGTDVWVGEVFEPQP